MIALINSYISGERANKIVSVSLDTFSKRNFGVIFKKRAESQKTTQPIFPSAREKTSVSLICTHTFTRSFVRTPCVYSAKTKNSMFGKIAVIQ